MATGPSPKSVTAGDDQIGTGMHLGKPGRRWPSASSTKRKPCELRELQPKTSTVPGLSKSPPMTTERRPLWLRSTSAADDQKVSTATKGQPARSLPLRSSAYTRRLNDPTTTSL